MRTLSARSHSSLSFPALLLLATLASFAPFSIDTYLPVLPDVGRELRASAGSLQLTLSGFLVGLVAGQLVGGTASDRVGRRPVLLWGVWGFMVASMGCALAPSLPTLVMSRFVEGFGGGAATVVTRAIVRDSTSGPETVTTMARLMTLAGLAPVLAPIAGVYIGGAWGWRGVFWALAATGLALLIASWRQPETFPGSRRETVPRHTFLQDWRSLLGDRSFSGYAAVASLAFAAMFVYIGWSSFILQGRLNLSEEESAFNFALNAAAFVACSALAGQLSRRHHERSVLAVALLGLSFGSALLGIGASFDDRGLILTALAVVVGSVGMALPIAAALAMAGQAARAGSASALLGTMQFSAAATAPALAALLTEVGLTAMATTIGLLTGGAVVALATAGPGHDATELSAESNRTEGP